ncbi:MAG: hypothetical protein AAFY88_16365 [Acidobacteriota bacterium]
MLNDDSMPRVAAGLDILKLNIDPEAGFVLSRLDGSTSMRDLRSLTGLSEKRLASILDRLDAQGALEASPVERARAHSPGAPARDDERGGGASAERSWRRIFERELHPLALDVRVERAAQVHGEMLRALCFDPSPRVIAAVFENPRCGLEHARLIADHHRSSRGLDLLGERPAFLRDRQVERHLFRNPQTSQRLLRRVFSRARMAKVYRLAVGHDATEHVREHARREFRQKFTAGTAEERVRLILDSEGRCLALLVGLSLDAKAAALLRGRAITSSLLIRNLARWPATPPPLLAHLVRQPQVTRNPSLRNLVLRHPNAPAELKRGLH